MSPSEVLGFGLSKRFGSQQALDGVDLALNGGLITILGPNGAGKTTLLRAIATVLSLDDGRLLIDGLDPIHEADRTEVRRRLGYLPQEPGLAGSARVVDVVDYIAVLKEHDDERRRRLAVFDALELVGMADRADDRVRDLSGGMRKRVAAAQAFLGTPSLLLLDEPASALDPEERLRLRQIIASRRHQATVVQSTHLTEEAVVSDSVLVMNQGRLIFVGPPQRLAAQAMGNTWVQAGEPLDAIASWRQADGSFRCLGTPPPGATLVDPSLEESYVYLQRSLAYR